MLLLLACTTPPPPAAFGESVTWSGAVELAEDHVVTEGSRLTIDAGAVITLAAEAGLVVEGELIARGTAEAPITIAGGRGVRFSAGATSASFTDVDDYDAGSIVEYTVIEGATRGMEIRGSSPYVHAVEFRGNEIPAGIDTIGGAGLLVAEGAAPRVRSSTFEANVANTFAFGGGLYVDRADPIVQDCTFTGNAGSYGGAISTDLMAAPIVGSSFSGNTSQSEGGAISLISTVSAVMANTVTGNLSATDGAGIHVCVTCDPHAAPYLYDNIVTGNLAENDDPTEGAAGIGAAYLGAMESNDVYDNWRGAVPSDFSWFHPVEDAWPDWVARPEVTNNWWGTADRAAIDTTVYDGADDDAFGVVTLDPVAAAPVALPSPRVTISSRSLHYAWEGETIAVFLTVYNPGPARTAVVSVTRNGAAFTVDLPADLPENSVWFGRIHEEEYDGSTVGEETWAVTLDGGDPVVARYLTGPVD